MLELGEEVGGFPVVGGVEGDNAAVFADEDGGERVGEGAGVRAGGDAEVEELGDLGELGCGWGGEVPVLKGFVGEAAGVGAAVAAEDLRGVVGGVEGDAEEVGFAVELGVGGEGLVDLGEVAAHAGAEVGGLAAGVDKGHEDGAAAELVEVDGAIALVAKGEVGDGVAGCGHVVLDSGFGVGAGLGDDDDAVEELVVEAVRAWFDEQGSGDAVAGVEFGGDGGIFELVGHGHGVHEAGDGLVVERDVRTADGDDAAAKGVAAGVGREGVGGGFGGGGFGRWGCGGRAAACEGERGEEKEWKPDRLGGAAKGHERDPLMLMIMARQVWDLEQGAP